VRVQGGPVRRRFELPRSLGPGPVVVQPVVRRAGVDGWLLDDLEPWRALGARLVRRGARHVKLALPPVVSIGESLDLRVTASRLPPAKSLTGTRPVVLGPGTVLRVAVAVHPLGPAAGAPRVAFRLVAQTAPGRQELLREVLDPAHPENAGWHEHRVELGALTGRPVRFFFSTRVRPCPVGRRCRAFSAPLWGAPQILEPRPRAGRHNLLLISLDTLRADHVGAYGSRLPTTPVLDAMAAEGALFEQTIAPFPATLSSHASMLTGVYPRRHGVLGMFDRIPRDIPMLAEILAHHGYQSAAVTEDGMVLATAGFPRGFTYYREYKGAKRSTPSGRAVATFDAGLRWLETHRGEQFFLFLHTYQVHMPYAPPPAFDVFTSAPGTEANALPELVRCQQLYAGEVRYVDSAIGRLFERLTKLGEADRTLVVVTSDHGEEFGEHGGVQHAQTIYEEVLHVPLILRAPRLVPAGVRVPGPVSLVDLLPTVLDLLGIPPPPATDGRSLVPLLRDPRGTSPVRPVFFEVREPLLQMALDLSGDGGRACSSRLIAPLAPDTVIEQVGARTNAHKWIFHLQPVGLPEVYDLEHDPHEHHNIAGPDLLPTGERLVEEYQALATPAADRRPDHKAPPATIDEETTKKLRALGYVQ